MKPNARLKGVLQDNDLRASQLIPVLKPGVLGGTEQVKGNTDVLLPTQVPIHQSVLPTHGLARLWKRVHR